MIEEDSDNAEDYIISQNSVENEPVSPENSIIADSSSPFKNETEAIIEIYSPEIKKRKMGISLIENQSSKKYRKSSNTKRKLLENRPFLSISINKRNATSQINRVEPTDPAETPKLLLLNKNFSVVSDNVNTSQQLSLTEVSKGLLVKSSQPLNLSLSDPSFSRKLCDIKDVECQNLMEKPEIGLDSLFNNEDNVPSTDLIETPKLLSSHKEFSIVSDNINTSLQCCQIEVSKGSFVKSSSSLSLPLTDPLFSRKLNEVKDLGCENLLDQAEVGLDSSFNNKDNDRIIEVDSESLQIDSISQEAALDSVLSDTNSKDSHAGDIQVSSSTGENYSKTEGTNYVPLLNESLAPISKAPKKGTLLERAYKVVSTMKKDSALYSHEITVGLRTSRGSFVSDVLIVKSIYLEESSYIVECLPLFNNSDSEQEKNSFIPKRLESVKMFLFISEMCEDLKVNCRLVIHFPVLAMFDVHLKRIFIFMENRVQLISKASSLPSVQCGIEVQNEVSAKDCKKIFRNLKSKTSKNVLDAVIGHLLIARNNLELDILYKSINRKENKTMLLTVDSERQFCMVCLRNSEKIDNIQTDAVYIFNGFSLTKCFDFDCKLKYIAEYYACGPVYNSFMFEFESVWLDSKINLIKKLEPRIRQLSSINYSILTEELLEQRQW